jgi:hypothetical protein
MLLRRSGCRSATAAEVLCVAASLATSLQEAQEAGSVTMSGEMADNFFERAFACNVCQILEVAFYVPQAQCAYAARAMTWCHQLSDPVSCSAPAVPRLVQHTHSHRAQQGRAHHPLSTSSSQPPLCAPAVQEGWQLPDPAAAVAAPQQAAGHNSGGVQAVGAPGTPSLDRAAV